MSGPRGITLALDLARMPALAQSIEKPPLPADIFEVMRIAAGSPQICQSASQVTGQPPLVLIKAARFYLQQVLLRPDADPYHVLGLPPGASRELARRHMRCLLQWLHPDVNRDWDSVYAERVLKAWREVSANVDSSRPSNSRSHVLAGPGSRTPVNSAPRMRMPWIEKPKTKMKKKQQPRHVLMPVAKRIGIGVGVVALLVAVLIAVYATNLVSS
jgi:hypothetical protein